MSLSFTEQRNLDKKELYRLLPKDIMFTRSEDYIDHYLRKASDKLGLPCHKILGLWWEIKRDYSRTGKTPLDK